jgi:inorganic pyrophosphatase
MNLLHDVSPGDNTPDEINVIIEIPRYSKNKYEIDKKNGLIKLDRAMRTSQDYPFDYGFMPQSLWDDGDALDVVVLTTYPLAPSILVEVRPVAIMTMIDDGDSDDKVVAVPVEDPRFEDVKDLKDLNPHFVKEMQHFFETYKKIDDKEVEIKGFEGAAAAKAAVKRSIELYKKDKKDQK